MDWLTRVERTCAAGLADRPLRDELLALVRTKVSFSGHVFALTDPVTRVVTSPHADLPGLAWERLPELVRLRYLSHGIRVDRIAGGPAVSHLRSGHPSPAHDEVLADLGIVDSAVVAFADRYGVWGYLELMRDSAFGEEELATLSALRPAVTGALRTAIAATFLEPSDRLVAVGPAVIVLGADLTVRSQTAAAGDALLRLLPPGEPVPPVPAAAYNIGAALLALEAGVPVGEPRARVHVGGGRWVTVKASRLGDDIAVSLEPSTSLERADVLARACGLSARETEVLGLLLAGRESKEIAAELVLSEHTVNDHVKAVLTKTGARTRQRLAGRVG